MKILLIEPFGHYEGHPSSYPKYFSRALADIGLDVAMASFEGFPRLTKGDAKVKHVSVFSKSGILAFLLRLLRGFLRLVTPLRLFVLPLETFFTFLLAFRENGKRRYDVIHTLDASMLPLSFLAFASVAKNSSLVLTISNPPAEQFKRSSLKEYILTKLGTSKFTVTVNRFLYRRAIKRNRVAFVCHSKSIQNLYAKSLLYDRLVCIPWGMEKLESETLTQHEARQYLGLPQDGKLLLSFGINHPRKNFEVIFQAIQNLSGDFRLLFAGEIVSSNAKENDPKRFAQEYGCSRNTIIVDKHIPEEEMPYYFCAADAIILSYRKDFLGASGILSHATGFRLPVIASDIGQIGEFVKSYGLGLTFIPEDSHSLRGAILSFLDLGEEEEQKMKNNLAQFASNHSWGRVAKEHLELYKELLGQ